MFGPLLSSAQLEQLQPRPRLLAQGAGQPPQTTSRWKQFLRRALWREYRETFASIIAASRKRPDVRDAAYRAISIDVAKKPAWMVDDIPHPQTYSRAAQRSDATLLRLDFLIVSAAAQIYRAEKGEWPKDLDMLAESGVLGEAERDRMIEEMIGLRIDERGAVEIKAPQVNERGPSDLVATLGSPEER